MHSSNHNVQLYLIFIFLNFSKQWIYLQYVVTIYTKALAHIYNCPCVDLFLLDQCVINVVYVYVYVCHALKLLDSTQPNQPKTVFSAMEHEKYQPTQPTKNGWSQQNTTLAFKVRL